MSRAIGPEQRREEIAEATWSVIERSGAEGASLREIAREAGYTTGVLSHHFASKRELLAYALGLVVDRQTRRLRSAAAEGDLRAALAELLPLDAQRSRECVIWLALTTASRHDAALAAELERRCAQASEAIGAALRRASVPVDDGSDAVDAIAALIDGITVSALGQPRRYPRERQLALLDHALARLVPGGAPPPG